eukprot:TRINITY_DN44222_c0_g1_i1.p1 TRINITY_DN44222_c0_g1~~TRINITY_DN44222_c0_g1_i1.p1  ORF type:complete len:420 (+),score=128.87 TRINITY_DN44222_c0_g1_i1:71-1261(+)
MDPAPQTVEGRSAGKAPLAGRLRIGQIVSIGPHAKASIPSRFETVLNTGMREKDAFGTRTHRFDEPLNDLPGPGSYRKARTLAKPTPSQSKKGTGSFASASRIAADQPRALFISPGPGAYASDGHRSPAPPSSSFALPVPRRAVIVPPGNLKPQPPGPGEYEVPAGQPRKDFSKLRQSAIFSSRTKREEPAKVAGAVPGPGEYTGADDKPRGGMNAVFKSITNREGASMIPKPAQQLDLGELAKTLPAPPVAGPELFQVNRSASPRSPARASELLGRADSAKDPQSMTVADEIIARKRRPKPSSMFAPTVLDRFGRPTVRYVPEEVDPPGPGQYHLEPGGKRMLISSSWAMNGTERFDPPTKERWRPPGPAFYTPPMPPERLRSSFHMNTKGVWVG